MAAASVADLAAVESRLDVRLSALENTRATDADLEDAKARILELEATVKALQLNAGPKKGVSMLDSKEFQKAEIFDGSKAKYITWAKRVKTMLRIHPDGKKRLDFVEKVVGQVGQPWAEVEGNVNLKAFNDDLHSVLVHLTEGEAASLVSAQEMGNGECNAIEAWRQIKLYCDPTNEGRDLVDLTTALKVKESKTLLEARQQLLNWEDNFKRMSSEAQKSFSDNILRSIFLNMMPKADRVSIERAATATHFHTSLSIKAELIRLADIDSQDVRPKSSTARRSPDDMDVDQLQQSDYWNWDGSWDGQQWEVPSDYTPQDAVGGDLMQMYGKGDTKGQGFKGKGKGKGGFSPYNSYGGGKKGGKKGGGKGEKGGKDNGKGSGFQGYCHYCWEWGHSKQYCPHKSRPANQLEGQDSTISTSDADKEKPLETLWLCSLEEEREYSIDVCFGIRGNNMNQIIDDVNEYHNSDNIESICVDCSPNDSHIVHAVMNQQCTTDNCMINKQCTTDNCMINNCYGASTAGNGVFIDLDSNMNSSIDELTVANNSLTVHDCNKNNIHDNGKIFNTKSILMNCNANSKDENKGGWTVKKGKGGKPKKVVSFNAQAYEAPKLKIGNRFNALDGKGLKVKDRPLHAFPREEGEVTQDEKGDKWVKLSMTADTGASDTVFPTSWFPEVAAKESAESRAGVTYRAANGKPLPNRGMKDLEVTTQDGQQCRMRVQLADIHKPLFSLGRSTEKGHRVVLDDGAGSYLEHKGSGQKVALRKENGVYMLDVWVKIPSSGFGRPGSK